MAECARGLGLDAEIMPVDGGFWPTKNPVRFDDLDPVQLALQIGF